MDQGKDDTVINGGVLARLRRRLEEQPDESIPLWLALGLVEDASRAVFIPAVSAPPESKPAAGSSDRLTAEPLTMGGDAKVIELDERQTMARKHGDRTAEEQPAEIPTVDGDQAGEGTSIDTTFRGDDDGEPLPTVQDSPVGSAA